MANSKYFYHENDVDWRTFSGIPEIFALDKGRFKVLCNDDTKDLWFGVYELDPGEEHWVHRHDDVAELYYIMSGTAQVRVGDEVRECGPGTGIYMPVGSWHGIKNTGKDVLSLVWSYNRPRGYGNAFVWEDPKLQAIWEKQNTGGSKLKGQ